MSPLGRRRSRFGPRALSATVILSVGAGLVGFAIVSAPEHVDRTDGPGFEPLRVETMEIVWEDGYSVDRAYVGRVEARQESEIGFEIPGLIRSIEVDEGQNIERGAVVAELDSARLEARRAELAANLTRAEADAALTTLTLERISEARRLGAASPQEWDEADKANQAALAVSRQAAAAVASVDVDLEKTVIRSPFDAVVARRYVDTGRVASAGLPIVRLIERTHPEVRVGVGSQAVDALEIGQQVSTEINDRTVSGRVSAILPTRDRAGRGVDVVIDLDTKLGTVRSGDLARIRLPRRVHERGFWIPIRALSEGSRGLWSVLIAEPNSDSVGFARLRRTEAEVLHQETDSVFARAPMAARTRIVVSGLHRVSAGMEVRVDHPGSVDSGAQP